MTTATKPSSAGGAPFAKGSIIWQKKGPLPVWAWALILLGLILVVVTWRRNRRLTETAEYTIGTDELPAGTSLQPVFVVPQAATPAVNVPVTVNTPGPVPPGGGRTNPPGPPPNTPKPKPPGHYEPVVSFGTSSPHPWNSTISGMAAHFGISDWHTIWNHPLNADLRSLRREPRYIRPADRVFIPGK